MNSTLGSVVPLAMFHLNPWQTYHLVRSPTITRVSGHILKEREKMKLVQTLTPDFNTREALFEKNEFFFDRGYQYRIVFWIFFLMEKCGMGHAAWLDNNWIVFEANRARTGQFTQNPIMKSDLCQLCKPIVRNQDILWFLWTLSFTNQIYKKHKIN